MDAKVSRLQLFTFSIENEAIEFAKSQNNWETGKRRKERRTSKEDVQKSWIWTYFELKPGAENYCSSAEYENQEEQGTV